jgi:hypothetical protein
LKIPDYLLKLIESGRQVGKRGYILRGGESIYQSMAIQGSWNGYVAYYYEIPEAQMGVDEAAKEIRRAFKQPEEALAFLRDISESSVDDLAPLKGTKVFELNEK